MSQVTGSRRCSSSITLTRGIGQSALSIVSLAMVGKWFRRRLTQAMAVYALVMSVGFMLAFPAVGALVLARGWRMAWAAIGVALLLGLAPLAWLLGRSSPEAIGLEVDGDAGPERRCATAGGVGRPPGRRSARRRSGCSPSPAPPTA